MVELNYNLLISLGLIFFLWTVTSCKSEHTEKVGRRASTGGVPTLHPQVDKTSAEDQLNFSFLTNEYITNSQNVLIAWEKLESATSYLLEVSYRPGCPEPEFYFSQFENEKRIGAIKDGAYYFCVFGITGNGLEIPAQNNGLKIVVDSLAPIITSPESGSIEANAAFNPSFEIEDTTTLSYSWQATSGEFFAENPDSAEPWISFGKNGTYKVKLKVMDQAGNSSQREFTVIWTGSDDSCSDPPCDDDYGESDILDYNLRFERSYYQTTSIKRVLMDGDHFTSGMKISQDSNTRWSVIEEKYENGVTTLLVTENPYLIGNLSYGRNELMLSILNGTTNQSITAFTLKDFTFFTLKPNTLSVSGLNGGFTHLNGTGRYSKRNFEMVVGFEQIISQ